jgi:hypothetical protein
MKKLTLNDCQKVSAGTCESTQDITVNSKSQWKGFPVNGLYLMGMRVENLAGDVIFSGTSGSFEYKGITYNVNPGVYSNGVITTVYHFTEAC